MSNLLLPATSLLVRSMGWALLYSLWQGLLICCTLMIVLRLLKNAGARLKYNISMLSFTGLFVWFADTWLTEWQRLQKVTIFITETGAGADSARTTPLTTFSQPQNSNTLLHSLLPQLEKYMPLIVGVYIIGLLFMLSRFMLNLFSLRALRNKGLVVPDENLQSLFTNGQLQLNIKRPIKFFISKHVHIPMMMGTLKPVILLPLASINHLSTDQLEAILLHELAHIKRHDYLLNIFQTIVETVLFFNPFVWWMSSIIRREREHCCDDLVIANTSATLPYAKALATLESQRYETGSLALAASGNKNQLFNRIKRIMEMKKHSINYAQLTTAIILIVVLAVSISWLTPGFAQKANNKQDPKKEEKTVTKQKIIIIDDDGNKKEYNSIDKLPKAEREKLRKELDGDETKGKKTVKKEVIIKNGDSKTDEDEDMGVVVKQALDNVDFDKIGREVNEALKEVGVAMKEAGDAMKQVDWSEVSKNLQTKLEEIKKELPDTGDRKEMTIKIKRKMDEAGKAFDEITEKIEKSQQKKEIAYAYSNSDDNSGIHVSAPAYDKMLKKMEADGLIDRVAGYTVEKKGNRLFINDIEQSKSVFNKYEHYFQEKNVTVKGDKDHIKTNVAN